MKKLLFIGTSMFIFMQFVNAQIIIPKYSNWKYLDDGSNQDTAWAYINYIDTSWTSGNAQLGYGDGDENTVISYGNNSSNKHITYYFRKTINIANPSLKDGLIIKLLRDDGAIVYINGIEVVRSNMPTGTIGYQTHAASTVAGSKEDKYYSTSIPSTYLVTGQNLIAVEVHQRKPSSSDLSFDLSLEFSNLFAFRKQPYLLYTGQNNEMLIVWQMLKTDTCTISWGTDTNYISGTATTYEYGTDHQHKFTITNLNPNTLYYYKVNIDSTNFRKASFRTGKQSSDNTLSFYAYGDTRTNPNLHDSVAKQIMNEVSLDPASQTFIVSSGDFVSNGDIEDDWDNQFFSPSYKNIQNMLANLPYLVSLGNHGGQGVLFEKYFPIPLFTNNRFYYSFDYGPVHFSVLDQFAPLDTASAQYHWLENDLATNTKKWKIILLHKPGWSAGGHSNNSTVQSIIQPLCVNYGVHFVIAGHNHYYSRAVVNGVQHITSGGGGAPLYTPLSNAANIVTVDKSLHFIKFMIHNDSLNFTAIRADGSIIETLSYDITNIEIQKESDSRKQYRVYSFMKTIYLINKSPQAQNLEVYNGIGQLVYANKFASGQSSFNIDKTGVYFVRVFTNKTMTFHKLIIR